VSRLSRPTRILIIVAVVIVILFIVGLIGGAVGRALEIDSPGFLHVPVLEVHSFFKGDALTGSEAGPGDAYISNTMIASWITVIVVLAIAFAATRKMRIVPRRIQGLVEVMLETLLNFVEGVAGRHLGRKFFPVVATIFIFVIFNAYLALLPFFGPGIYASQEHPVEASTDGVIISVEVEDGAHVEEGQVIFYLEGDKAVEAHDSGHIHFDKTYTVGDTIAQHEQIAVMETKPPLFRSANTDINMTLALALVAVFFIEFWGFRARGPRHYISEYANFGELKAGIGALFRGKIKEAPMMILTGIINVVMGGLEALSHGTRVISFAFRLFGNMTAGEILLLSATFLIPWIMAIPFYGLELLVGFIQALIFGGLTIVWGTMAASHEAEEHQQA